MPTYIYKNSAEYARILNVSDAVHNIRSLYKLLSSYRDRPIQNTVKHLRWNVLQNLSAGAQPEFFQKHLVNKKRKTGLAGKHFGVFSLHTLKTKFLVEPFTKKWTQSVFSILKRAVDPPFSPPPSSCTPEIVAEYTSITLNMCKYP